MGRRKLSNKERKASKARKRERDAERQRQRRMDPDFRGHERERNTAAQRVARMDLKYRERQRVRDTAARRIARMNPEYRERERQRNAAYQRARRLDPMYREQERQRNAAYQRARRMDPMYREQEQQHDTLAHQFRRNGWSQVAMQFNENMADGQTEAWNSCERLWFVTKNSQSGVAHFKVTVEVDPEIVYSIEHSYNAALTYTDSVGAFVNSGNQICYPDKSYSTVSAELENPIKAEPVENEMYNSVEFKNPFQNSEINFKCCCPPVLISTENYILPHHFDDSCSSDEYEKALKSHSSHFAKYVACNDCRRPIKVEPREDVEN